MTVVSRWLVMPTAAIDEASRSARASAPPHTWRVLPQISDASCSTHPARGKICWCSSWSTATTRPEWSKIMHRVEVVPWSIAATYWVIPCLLYPPGRRPPSSPQTVVQPARCGKGLTQVTHEGLPVDHTPTDFRRIRLLEEVAGDPSAKAGRMAVRDRRGDVVGVPRDLRPDHVRSRVCGGRRRRSHRLGSP